MIQVVRNYFRRMACCARPLSSVFAPRFYVLLQTLAATLTILALSLIAPVVHSFQTLEYSGLWLPHNYFPQGFKPSPYSDAKQTSPLRSDGTQVIEYKIAVPGRDEKQEWVTVFIDGMSLHKSAADAKKYRKHYHENITRLIGPINIGDEAFADSEYVGNDGSLCRSFLSENNYNKGQVHMRKLLLRYLRVGRMQLGIRVNSLAVEGLRKVANGTRWYTAKEPLSCDQMKQVASKFASRIRAYGQNQKWLPPISESNSSTSSITLDPDVDSDNVVDGEDLESSTLPEEIPPGTTAAVALAASGIAAGGALAMLGMSGVGRREIVDSVRDLVNGEPMVDEFEAWKEKYEAMGWRYSEENGIADFEPVDGAVNEGGWVYFSEHGGFIPPAGERTEPELQPEFRDGDVNPDTDEVWSDEDDGWIGRNLYEQEKARTDEIADIEARSEKAMQVEDEKTRDLGRKVTDAERQRRELAAVFDARRTLEDAIHHIWLQDLKDGVLDEERKKLLANLERKAEQISMRKDRTGVVEDTLALADIIEHQARNGFKVTYTYRDAVFDTTIQTGAAILDAVATRGYASSVVGSGLAMRDAAREGKGGTDILYEGVKAAAFDFAIGKAADVVGGAVRATGTAWREAGEAVEEAAKITRKLDGVAHGGSDLLSQTERNLNRMRNNLSLDVKGRPRAKLEDVLEVQRNPHQVRNLKGTGTHELQNGFNNTLRSEVYKPHDKALILRLKSTNPDLADKKLVVHEFRTPGKSGSGINTDRDFRMLYKNDKGEWIEVPRKKWEKDSNEIFGELTGYDPKKCPPDIPDDKKMEWWAEQHGHTPTDRSFREACPDYSDQVLNEAGERVRASKPRIQELKELVDEKVIIKEKPANPLRLRDPVSIGSQFDEKIATNMRRGDSFEAVAQAKKGVETLESVRTAYSKQKIDAGVLPERFSKAMDLIKKSNLPSHPDPAVLRGFNNDLQKLGFANLDVFGKALSGQFESLKYAK